MPTLKNLKNMESKKIPENAPFSVQLKISWRETTPLMSTLFSPRYAPAQ
jgi:hypothetical protein